MLAHLHNPRCRSVETIIVTGRDTDSDKEEGVSWLDARSGRTAFAKSPTPISRVTDVSCGVFLVVCRSSCSTEAPIVGQFSRGVSIVSQNSIGPLWALHILMNQKQTI